MKCNEGTIVISFGKLISVVRTVRRELLDSMPVDGRLPTLIDAALPLLSTASFTVFLGFTEVGKRERRCLVEVAPGPMAGRHRHAHCFNMFKHSTERS